jgi:hypothetical protein
MPPLVISTTLAAQLGHNTSANPAYNKANFPANFTGTTWTDTSHTVLAVDSTKSDDSLNPVTPCHVSPVSVKTLIPGFTGFAKAHWQGWFRSGGGGGHKDVGINSQSPTYIASMVADMMRRGFDGLIIDWYGSGSYSDGSALALKTYLTANPSLAFTYSIQIDAQSYANTSDLNTHLAYIEATYFGTTGYQQQGGNPVISFFDSVVGVNYVTAKATISASYWIHQGSGSLANADTDAAFDWVQPYSDGIHVDRYNDTAKNSFLTNAHSSAKGSIIHIAKGFDGYLSTWKQGWYLPGDNGKCWLHQASVNAANMPTHCIGMHINWDDEEEGTGVENGIDNAISVTASISGNTLSWSVSGGTGDETTIFDYLILASPDNVNAAILGSIAKGVGSLDLGTFTGWTVGVAFQIYVIAVGQPCVRNQVSAAVSFTVSSGGSSGTGGGSTGGGLTQGPSTQTVLFPPPTRGSNVQAPLQGWLLTLQNLHPLVTIDTTAGNVVIDLPPAGLNTSTGQSNQNQEITFRKTSPDANTVTINGAEDGPQVLTTNTGTTSRVRFKSDGTDYWVTG